MLMLVCGGIGGGRRGVLVFIGRRVRGGLAWFSRVLMFMGRLVGWCGYLRGLRTGGGIVVMCVVVGAILFRHTAISIILSRR